MDEEKKNACEDWHAEQVAKGEVWNFQQELLSYCESDVKLLKEGCLKFAEDTQQDAGFNPLTQCITIASTTHYFWRNHQMEPKTIAVEPPHGWGGLKTCQSKVVFQWLFHKDKQLGGNRIKHARNGGEQVIPIKRGKVRVNGYDPLTKTVYEFHDCEFRGCRRCKPHKRHNKTFHHPDRTVEEMYQATKAKTELVEKAGYTVIEQWECEFKKELKQNEELKDLVNNMTRVSLLDPTIKKYGTYPIGHPQIIVNPENKKIKDYFGIAKVDVLAPEKLLHPVLLTWVPCSTALVLFSTDCCEGGG